LPIMSLVRSSWPCFAFPPLTLPPNVHTGHSTFGGAAVAVLNHFLNSSASAIFPLRIDADGYHPGVVYRTMLSFAQMEHENAYSRFWGGVHWESSNTEGILLGRKIGDWVLRHVALPVANSQL